MYDHWGLINLGCCMLLYLAVLTILFSAAIFAIIKLSWNQLQFLNESQNWSHYWILGFIKSFFE